MKILQSYVSNALSSKVFFSCKDKEAEDSSYNLRIIYRYSPQNDSGRSRYQSTVEKMKQ